MTQSNPPGYHLRYVAGRSRSEFNAVAFSPDGKVLAGGSHDYTVRLWDAASGKLLKALDGHTDRVSSVAWSPDGKRLASGSHDHTVRTWDAANGRLLKTQEGHRAEISGVAWSPDGTALACSSHDHTVRIWDAEPFPKALVHSDMVFCVAWSPDGKVLASGSYDHTVRIWVAASGKMLNLLKGHKDLVFGVAWSPDGKVLASGSHDHTVRLWDVASGKLLNTLKAHTNGVNGLAWSPDGKRLVSSSHDTTVRVWDVADGSLLYTSRYHTAGVISVAWSPDGKVLASGSHDYTVRMWNAASGKLLKTITGHSDLVSVVEWSADGKVLVSGSDDKRIHIWDAASGKLLKTLEGHGTRVRSVAWSPDGKALASGSYHNTVRVWNAAKGNLQSTLDDHGGEVSSLAWSPDGVLLACGSHDYTIRIWSAIRGTLLNVLTDHRAAVRSVAWSPDGKSLASGSDDKTLRIWDVVSGKLLQTLAGHAVGVRSVAWSPDGKDLVSGSDDKTLRIWNAASGKLLKTLEGHTAGVISVAWSPDGKLLASGSDDKTVRVWDAQSGDFLELYDLRGFAQAFVAVAFTPVAEVATSFGTTVLGDVNILVGTEVLRATGNAQPSARIVSAKIVLMGESGVGKSGLALRLAEQRFEPQVSTHGMRLWPLAYNKLVPDAALPAGEQREIMLWDLGGQAEYRLVHQLFLHDTTLALMLLDPTRDSHFDDVEEWNLRLHKQLRGQSTGKLLVGTQADLLDPRSIDHSRVEQTVRKWQMHGFHLTSAKDNTGIDELRARLAQLIEWEELSTTTRPRLWQRIRELIDELRKEGQIVVMYSALEKGLRAALQDEYDGEVLGIIVGQLARQGVITDTRLATGERALLLQIGYVEIYAGSLILLAREAAQHSGVPALEVMDATSRQSYPGISAAERITDPLTERNVLECVIELMIEHGICLKHERLLVFPVLFPKATAADTEQSAYTVSLYYDFSGAIDNIYSALVAQLAVSQRFGRVRLWKDRAEFAQAGQGVCALRRLDRVGGWSHVDLLFSHKTAPATRDLFTALVEAHLQKEGVTIREVLEMDCPYCGRRVEESLLRMRIEDSKEDILCPRCERRLPISPGAKKNDPQVAQALTALRKTIAARKQDDIVAAKRELDAALVFISCASADAAMCDQLLNHLSGLQRQGLIRTWYERQILPSADQPAEISHNLSRASIVLLLLSADYLASGAYEQPEMQRALARHAAGQARVIPVLMRPVAGWQQLAFGMLPALPTSGQPVSSWPNADAAFADIVVGVQRAAEALMRPSQETAPRVLVTESPQLPNIEPTPLRILHLSDLHFGKDDEPLVQLQPLLHDLQTGEGLGFDRIDYLVISGDLTQRATEAEFEKAYQFVSQLIQELKLSAARVVITPGNHDQCWEPPVYQWQPRRKVDVSKLPPDTYVAQGEGNLVREEASYPKRWDNFARFYHQLTQHPYANRPEAQCRAMLFDEARVQFLEMNSAWAIDEYFRERAGIHPSGLASGLLQANKQVDEARKSGRIAPDASVFRIAVWHHPVTGNEKIPDDAFIDQLRQNQFQLCLHGHVHEDRTDVINYLHPRRLHVAGAGSFGAPRAERPESTPRLYNVLELARDHSRVVVHTRCLRRAGGAWEGWAVWPDGDATKRRTFYEIRFPYAADRTGERKTV